MLAVTIEVYRDRQRRIEDAREPGVERAQAAVGVVDAVAVEDLDLAVTIEVRQGRRGGTRTDVAGLPFDGAVMLEGDEPAVVPVAGDDLDLAVAIDVADRGAIERVDVDAFGARLVGIPQPRAIRAAKRAQYALAVPVFALKGNEDQVGRIALIDQAIAVVVSELGDRGRAHDVVEIAVSDSRHFPTGLLHDIEDTGLGRCHAAAVACGQAVVALIKFEHRAGGVDGHRDRGAVEGQGAGDGYAGRLGASAWDWIGHAGSAKDGFLRAGQAVAVGIKKGDQLEGLSDRGWPQVLDDDREVARDRWCAGLVHQCGRVERGGGEVRQQAARRFWAEAYLANIQTGARRCGQGEAAGAIAVAAELGIELRAEDAVDQETTGTVAGEDARGAALAHEDLHAIERRVIRGVQHRENPGQTTFSRYALTSSGRNLGNVPSRQGHGQRLRGGVRVPHCGKSLSEVMWDDVPRSQSPAKTSTTDVGGDLRTVC